MTSEQARELFSAAYDAELSASEQAAFDQSIASDLALAAEYREFRATLDAIRVVPSPATTTPDLLKGVQRRLRTGSGGRFYADRFAERSGVGWFQPWVVLLALVGLIALLWLGFRVLHVIQLAP